MAKMHWKNLDTLDEKRKFDKGLLELVTWQMSHLAGQLYSPAGKASSHNLSNWNEQICKNPKILIL